MKKLMFALFSGTIVMLAGCLKTTDNTPTDCSIPTTTAPASETALVKHYLDSIGVTTAILDSRGFYYTIDSSASTVAAHPSGCSGVGVSYVGKFTNGITFDSASDQNPVYLYLDNTIIGWREALPLMKINTTMNLYLPPGLAYGSTGAKDSNGNQVIPPNAILIFNIKLLAIR